MNLNKLFPRLSIRTKLVTAFVGLAIIPLAIVMLVGLTTLSESAREFGFTTLNHDVEQVRRRVEHALRDVEQHLEFVAEVVGEGNSVENGRPGTPPDLLLGHHTEIERLKVVDASGEVRVNLVRGRGEVPQAEREGDSGVLYSFIGEALEPGQLDVLPVELRGHNDGSDVRTLPSLAFVVSLFDDSGSYRGVVVAEVDASSVFAAVDVGSPYLEGATVLVRSDGTVLYHSLFKRDWDRLLQVGDRFDLETDLPGEVISALLAGDSGTVQLSDRRIVSYTPLQTEQIGIRDVYMYRSVPELTFQRTLTRASIWFTVGGILLLVAVTVLALLASKQFLKPIIEIRAAIGNLVEDMDAGDLLIETNDELEDLAADVNEVSRDLRRHRHELSSLVVERTRELEHAHAELKALWQHSADAIIGVDRDGNISTWNEGATRLLGYSESEVTGRSVDELLPPDTAAEGAFVARELRDSGVVNLITRRCDRAGECFMANLTITRIDDGDDVAGYSWVLRDHTMQARMEDQMRRSERLAAMSVMAAGLAHEINNPLAILGNRIECMQRDVGDGPDAEWLKKDLDVLASHTERLRGLTGDLLRFARDDDEQVRAVQMNDVCRRMASLMDRTLAKRQITLSLDLANDLPTFMGHEKSLETVLVNLLINAADATPEGGQVVVGTQRCEADHVVRMTVTDSGDGVPEELRERIFQPFFTTKESGKGTGLGLAVCRSVVEQMGGTITVEGVGTGGSRFILTQPLEVAPDRWKKPAYS